LYTFLIKSQECDQLQEEKDSRAAFVVLSYIKKLCLHPQLLVQSSIEKKRHLGLLNKDEEAAL
jgi:hypothetical protein